jgi:hypothetical protein
MESAVDELTRGGGVGRWGNSLANCHGNKIINIRPQLSSSGQ